MSKNKVKADGQETPAEVFENAAAPVAEVMDAPVVEAVAEVIEMKDKLKAMEAAVEVSIKGGFKPEYVSEDANCFEGKNFAAANEHCLKNGLELFRVIYTSDGLPLDLERMGA